MPEIATVKEELQEAIIKGKRDAVEPLIRHALADGLNPEEIMNNIMIMTRWEIWLLFISLSFTDGNGKMN